MSIISTILYSESELISKSHSYEQLLFKGSSIEHTPSVISKIFIWLSLLRSPSLIQLVTAIAAPISDIVPSESRNSGDPEFIHGEELSREKSQRL